MLVFDIILRAYFIISKIYEKKSVCLYRSNLQINCENNNMVPLVFVKHYFNSFKINNVILNYFSYLHIRFFVT